MLLELLNATFVTANFVGSTINPYYSITAKANNAT